MKKSIILKFFIVSYSEPSLLYTATPNFHLQKNLEISLSELSEEILNKQSSFELLDVTEEGNKIVVNYWSPTRYAKVPQDIKEKLTNLESSEDRLVNRLYEAVTHRIDHLSPYHVQAFLGREFILKQLYGLYLVSNPEMDKSNFYKIVKKLQFIKKTGKRMKNVKYRPPMIYTFKKGLLKQPVIFKD